MKPLHWTVYVSCAVLATTSLSMLIVSDVEDRRDFGRWGIAAGLLAIIVASIVVADRFSRRVCKYTHLEAEHQREEIQGLIDAEGERVIAGVHDQTEDIAEAVCKAVVKTVTAKGATPIRGR